jgi:hypothetical protein
MNLHALFGNTAHDFLQMMLLQQRNPLVAISVAEPLDQRATGSIATPTPGRKWVALRATLIIQPLSLRNWSSAPNGE